MTKCSVCGEEVILPFKCRYCGEYFCAKHRLPEQHGCLGIMYAASPREKEFKERKELEEAVVQKGTAPRRKEYIHMLVASALVFAVGISFVQAHLLSALGIFIALGFVASFLVHELAHRVAARRSGLRAEFRISSTGAILTAISALPYMPFKIIAPGAVVVYGVADKDTIGKVAAHGPAVNLLLSIAFFIMSMFLTSSALRIVYSLALINAWISFFNLLPFEPFDGRKVIGWNIAYWLGMFIPSIFLFIFPYIMMLA